MRLSITSNRVSLSVELPGITPRVCATARQLLDQELAAGSKNRDAIAATFLHLLRSCPKANASDLWHHIVYRQYLEVLPHYRPQDAGQSWKRASGDALEVVIQQLYSAVFASHQIEIEVLFNSERRKAALDAMGISADVGSGKLDMAIYAQVGTDTHAMVGGVHVKGSLAERISDDVPTSRAMSAKGFLSPLWTLDVKSFPPPQGDLVNRGELGTPEQPSEKRKYIENHGDFDHCYSANSRTVPSTGETRSGKRIYAITLSQQPDQFAKDIIARVESLRLKQH